MLWGSAPYVLELCTASSSLFLMPVGSLLAVLRLLARRAGAVGTGDVGLLLRLGFHLVVSSSFPSAATTEGDAILEYALKVVIAP